MKNQTSLGDYTRTDKRSTMDKCMQPVNWLDVAQAQGKRWGEDRGRGEEEAIGGY